MKTVIFLGGGGGGALLILVRINSIKENCLRNNIKDQCKRQYRKLPIKDQEFCVNIEGFATVSSPSSVN